MPFSASTRRTCERSRLRNSSPISAERCFWRYTFQTPLSLTTVSEGEVALGPGARIFCQPFAEDDDGDRGEGHGGQRSDIDGVRSVIEPQQRAAGIPRQQAHRDGGDQPSEQSRREAIQRELFELAQQLPGR